MPEKLPPLRPYQERELSKWRARPDKRLLLAWEMGGGKTYAVLHALHESRPETLLCVVPAILRPLWGDLLTRFFCDGSGPRSRVGVIRKNPSSSGATKADKAAWEKPWRVVSYDLLDAVAELGQSWDFIVFDEAHALRNPRSGQSRAALSVLQQSPKAAALGLSGTYIPNEAWQLWNPLRTFFPNEKWLGRPTAAGDAAWAFKERFCLLEMRYGHPHFYGLREEMRATLQELIAPLVSRVTQEEFARFIPPLFVEPLRVDVTTKDVASKWLAAVPDEVKHRGIFTHTRERAAKLAAELKGTLITGEFSPEVRAEKLAWCRQQEESLLVGTIDSLSEGISLSHIKAALVCEWTTEMSTLLQFVGRFARADSTSEVPTKVEIVVGPNDVERLARLKTRIVAANSIFSAGRAETLLEKAVLTPELSDDDFIRKTLELVQSIEKIERRGLVEDDDE